jgi:hypothetical protein
MAKPNIARIAWRIAGSAVVLVVGAVLVAFVVLSVADRRFQRDMDEHARYWESKVTREIPIGASREAAKAWAAANLRQDISVIADTERHMSVAAYNRSTPWPHFPCANWMILVHANWDADGRITDRGITQSGACL